MSLCASERKAKLDTMLPNIMELTQRKMHASADELLAFHRYGLSLEARLVATHAARECGERAARCYAAIARSVVAR